MRLVQLTAVAYVVGVVTFVTDVFNDGASAEMVRSVQLEAMDADAVDGGMSGSGAGRGLPPFLRSWRRTT